MSVRRYFPLHAAVERQISPRWHRRIVWCTWYLTSLNTRGPRLHVTCQTGQEATQFAGQLFCLRQPECDAAAADWQTECTSVRLVVGGNFPPWQRESALILLPSVRCFTPSLIWGRKACLTEMFSFLKSCKRISGTWRRAAVIFF